MHSELSRVMGSLVLERPTATDFLSTISDNNVKDRNLKPRTNTTKTICTASLTSREQMFSAFCNLSKLTLQANSTCSTKAKQSEYLFTNRQGDRSESP